MASPICNVQIDRHKIITSALNLLYVINKQKDKITENCYIKLVLSKGKKYLRVFD